MLEGRQKSFVGRAPPGPAGGAYSAPLYPLAGSWRKGGERDKERQEGMEEVGEERGGGLGEGGEWR